MSHFKQTRLEIKMQKDIRGILEILNQMKRIRGKAAIIKDCKRYLEHCSGWNPLIEEELVKSHTKIVESFNKFMKSNAKNL